MYMVCGDIPCGKSTKVASLLGFAKTIIFNASANVKKRYRLQLNGIIKNGFLIA